jgi:hypothetical protein
MKRFYYYSCQNLFAFLLFCCAFSLHAQNINENEELSDPVLLKMYREAGSPFSHLQPQKEVISARDLTSKTFIQENGVYTTIMGAGPVHYNEGGKWKTISTEITPNISGQFSNYSFVNEYNAFKTYYNGVSPNVKTILAGGGEVNLSAKGFALLDGQGNELTKTDFSQSVGNMQSAKAKYPNIANEIDAEITQLTIGFERDYVLKSANILNNLPANAQYLAFIEEVEMPNGWNVTFNQEAKNTATNALQTIHLNENGIEKMRYHIPQFYDLNPSQAQAEAISPKRITGEYKTQIIGNKLIIYTLVDINWLKSADRSFPVVIDPTVNCTPTQTTWWTGTVYNDGNTGLEFNDGMRSGNQDITWPGSNKYFQTYAKINLSSIPANACINSTTFYLYQASQNDGSGCDENKFRIGKANIDPVPSSWTAVHGAIEGLATEYSRWDVFGGAGYQDYNEVSSQWKTFPFGTAGNTDVKNQLAAAYITIGIDNLNNYDVHCYGPWDDSGWINWAGYTSAQRPYLAVDYSGNDLCAAAVTLTSGTNSTFSTVCAAQDGPNPSCGAGVFKEVWYKYTAPAYGSITLSTCGTATFDTRIAVFTGSCGAFTEVACNDDGSGCSGYTSQLTATVNANVTYYIAVGGYNGATGTGTLAFSYYAPPPVGSLQIGGLIVSATTITNTAANTYTCTGNVRIQKLGCGNDVLKFDNNLIVNTATNTISTPSLTLCKIYVPSVYSGGGSQDIYYGPFSFTVSNNVINFASNSLLNTLFKMASLDVKVDNFTVNCNGIVINGKLNFPDILSTYGNGKLDASISAISVTQNSGVDFVGTLHVENVKLYKTLLLNYLDANYNGPNNYFQGATKLTTPMFAINGATEIDNGVINYITLGVTLAHPQPIGTTGLSISSATGSVKNINSQVKPLTFQLGGVFVPTVTGDLTSIANLNLNLEYALGTYFAANGTVNLFDASVGNAGFKVWSNRFDAYGNVNLIAILRAYATFSIWKNAGQPVDLSGTFGGSVQMPNPSEIDNLYLRWALSALFSQGQVIATSDNYLRKQFLTGHAKINHNWFPRVSYYLGWSNSLSADIGMNYNAIPLSIRQEYGLGIKGLEINGLTAGMYGFNISKSSPEVVVAATSSVGIPQFKLITPEGDTITNSNTANYPYVIYQSDLPNKHCYMRLMNPKLGDYEVQIVEADSFYIYRVNTPPTITISNAVVNTTTKQVTVNWLDSDPDDNAKIALFLDNNLSGGDGILLAENIAENNVIDSYTFSYGNMKTGDYYIYAVIMDSSYQFNSTYYRTKLRLITNNAPPSPSGLGVTAMATPSLKFNFTRNNILPNRYNYILYYAINEPVTFASPSIAIGDTNYHEYTSFLLGKTYQFAITAIDTFGRESDFSNIVSVSYTSASFNDAPTIPAQNIPTTAFVGTTYNYTLAATDPENNSLTYSLLQAPSGMSISNSGAISWTPTSSQKGFQVVQVKVRDAQYADSILFQINVLDNQLRKSYINFDKTVYTNYGDNGLASIIDPDISANPNVIDSVSVRLYSKSDLVGITKMAKETDLNSRTFALRFTLTNSLSNTSSSLLHVVYATQFGHLTQM